MDWNQLVVPEPAASSIYFPVQFLAWTDVLASVRNLFRIDETFKNCFLMTFVFLAMKVVKCNKKLRWILHQCEYPKKLSNYPQQ